MLSPLKPTKLESSNSSRNQRRPQRSAAKRMPLKEQINLILGILNSFLEEDGLNQLGSYLDHVGFDIGVIRHLQDLPNAWLGHYRSKQGTYDVDRACHDLTTFPTIAAEIARLKNEKKGSLA